MMDKKDQMLSAFKNITENQKGKTHVKGVLFYFEGHYYPVKLFLIAGDGTAGESRKLDYGHLLMIEDWIDAEAAQIFLTSLGESEIISLSSYNLTLGKGYIVDVLDNPNDITQRVGFSVAPNDYERKLLMQTRSFPNTLLTIWPSQVFIFRYQPDQKGQGVYYQNMSSPLPFKHDLPVFPDYHAALNYWLSKESGYIGNWTILCSFPLQLTRIQSVRYGKEKFVINVVTDDKNLEFLQCKYYVEYGSMNAEQGVFNPVESKTINVQEDVKRLYLILYDTREPEKVIDYRDYNWRDPFGTLHELDPEYDKENLEYLIRNGEDKHLEFKLLVNDQGKEFLETISSFSNTEGGLILIGVDDHGHVPGLDERQLESQQKRIIDLIRHHIEPQVEVVSKTIPYKDKTIVVVEVPKGQQPPYNYKDVGVFIRASATDRKATRDEIIRLLVKENDIQRQ
ncbi:MAG: AlbA family DNA-binding domain-containing protein [Ignavibacteriaceae bacterium]